MLKEFAGGEEEEAFLGYESVTAHLIHTQVPVLYSGRPTTRSERENSEEDEECDEESRVAPGRPPLPVE